MYADALAISKVAELAGHEAVASDYREKAAAIKADIQNYLWRPNLITLSIATETRLNLSAAASRWVLFLGCTICG